MLRVAPSLDVRPNIHVPDTDTMKALLTHRFQAMTDYQRNVLAPLDADERTQLAALMAKLEAPLRR